MGTPIPDHARAVLRALPRIDAVAGCPAVAGLPRAAVVRAARHELAALRAAARRGELRAAPDADVVGERAAARAAADVLPQHRRVLNATGVVLHTGLGRAPLAERARRALLAAAGHAIVEIDPRSGERSQREQRVAALLGDLLPVGGGLVVNNNAAAVNLGLRALAEGRDVVVSRGELVEIGGGFRMPDVMALAGCRMIEVGATNRTHRHDYARAIGADTALLVKVHPSNFRMSGFVGTPSLAELVDLGREHGVPVFEDLGSGLLLSAPPAALEDEPRVADSVASGADLVCFSGDKLLGGPQCGILVGDAELVARCRRHPLYRAFRCDKLTLAALEATLLAYRDGDPLAELPTLRQIARDAGTLRELAADLAERLGDGARVVPSDSYVGSGAHPARPLPSFAVALADGGRRCAALRTDAELPLFGRVADGATLLDLRTLADEDPAQVAAVVARNQS